MKKHLLSFAENDLRKAGLNWVADSYLADFCKQKLSQTGKLVVINGQHIYISSSPEKARKKTNNKWFETQDSISYWEDFFKPKVMYPNMTQFMPFYFDEKKFFQNDKSFMITGKNLGFLTAFLNSSLFKYCFTENFPTLGEKGRELRKIFFDKIPVIQVDEKTEKIFEKAVTDIQSEYTEEKARKIDSMIFDLYKLTEAERGVIGYIEIK